METSNRGTSLVWWKYHVSRPFVRKNERDTTQIHMCRIDTPSIIIIRVKCLFLLHFVYLRFGEGGSPVSRSTFGSEWGRRTEDSRQQIVVICGRADRETSSTHLYPSSLALHLRRFSLVGLCKPRRDPREWVRIKMINTTLRRRQGMINYSSRSRS